MSVAQSFGTGFPAFAAASMIELPAGTETSTPSTVRVTFGPSRGGVPMSTLSRSSRNSDHTTGYSALNNRGRSEPASTGWQNQHFAIRAEAPCSRSDGTATFFVSSFSSFEAFARSSEIVREMGQRTHYGIGNKPAKCAQGSKLHGVAELLEHD